AQIRVVIRLRCSVQTGVAEERSRGLTSLKDVVDDVLAIYCIGQGTAQMDVIHRRNVDADAHVVGRKLEAFRVFLAQYGVGLDTWNIGNRNGVGAIQFASFVTGQRGGFVDHVEDNFIDLGLRHSIGSRPERVLDEGDALATRPFFYSIGAV